jgi:Protein of unknown function (DUF998)
MLKNMLRNLPPSYRTESSTAGPGGGALSPLTLGLVSCGGVGALLFTITYTVEGLTRPGYDATQQPISALSLSPSGWVQQVNFVDFGLLLVLSAVGWLRVLTAGRASLGFPLIQGLIGLCMIVVGSFSQDPGPGYPSGAVPGAPTLHGTIHTVAAYTIFFALAAGCFVLASRFATAPNWLDGRRTRWSRAWSSWSSLRYSQPPMAADRPPGCSSACRRWPTRYGVV